MTSIIVTAIICSVVFTVINAVISLLACMTALKITSKQLIAIIEECEKADKEKIFFEVWNNHNT